MLKLIIALFIGIVVGIPASGLRKDMESQYLPDFDNTSLYQKYAHGSLSIYLNPDELDQLMEQIMSEFPEAMVEVSVGQTYNNQTMRGYILGLNISGHDDWKDRADSRPTILLNGLHHARELTSVQMNVYTMMRLLYQYVKDDQETTELLNLSTIIFIPVVNKDGLDSIQRHFVKTGELARLRKNRHEYPNQAQCDKEVIGVDLNRNYPFKFAVDDEGSSSDPCSATYRGPSPLSEPETKAVSDFLDKWSNLKVILSFHAFGNLMIIPFNYDLADNAIFKSDYPEADEFYDNIYQNGGVPEGNIKGNGRVGVKYPANGEASDYFLAEKGLYSMSPELGTNDRSSQQFFVNNWSDMQDIVQQNYGWIFYTIKQLHQSLDIQIVQLAKAGDHRQISLNLQNKGLSNVQQDHLKLQLNMTLFSKVEALLDEQHLTTQCHSYHCKILLRDMPSESTKLLKLRFKLKSEVKRQDYEEIVLEYWPNSQLDPYSENPHAQRLEVHLDQFEQWSPTIIEPVPVEIPGGKTSAKTSILVVFFVLLLIVGVCLLASKWIKNKFREVFRINQRANLDADFVEPVLDQAQKDPCDEEKLFEKQDLEQQISSEDELMPEDQ